MKNVLKEIINSLGFAASAVVVVILLPMMFFSFMAIFSNPEAMMFSVVLLVIGGVLFYVMMQTPTQEEKDKKLWTEEKRVEDDGVRKDRKGRYLETTVEYEERVNVRKREHFQNLFFNKDIRNLFSFGAKNVPRRMAVTYFDKMLFTSVRQLDNMYYNCFIRQWLKNSNVADPYLTTKFLLDHAVKYLGYKSKDEIEKKYPKFAQDVRRSVTVLLLLEVYQYTYGFFVEPYKDLTGYAVRFPDGAKIGYLYDSTTETEEEFLQALADKITSLKQIVVEYGEKYLTLSEVSRRLEEEQNISISFKQRHVTNNFDWRLDAEERYEKLYGIKIKRGGEDERETGTLADP